MVKNSREARTNLSSRASYLQMVSGDATMRVLSYIIATVLFLTGPLMAGATTSDLPGIGTFSYNGSSVVTQIPLAMAAANVGQ